MMNLSSCGLCMRRPLGFVRRPPHLSWRRSSYVQYFERTRRTSLSTRSRPRSALSRRRRWS